MPSDAQFPKLVRLRAGEADGSISHRTGIARCARSYTRLERIWGAPPVIHPDHGGTVPIAAFIRELNVPAVIVPIVNFDNNQHGDNENLRLGNLWSGIVSLAAMVEM